MQENNCLKLPQMSSLDWCWKNEQHLNIYYNFYHQMSLRKSKCWYSNNCLHFLKCAVPFNRVGCFEHVSKSDLSSTSNRHLWIWPHRKLELSMNFYFPLTLICRTSKSDLSRGQYYKTLRIRNLQEIERCLTKLSYGLGKHTSLLQCPCITCITNP
jgi:hypothetical protein